jgi:hypothetical protein
MNAVLYAVLNMYNVHMSVVYINTMCTPPTHTTTYTMYTYKKSGGFNLISNIFWKDLHGRNIRN